MLEILRQLLLRTPKSVCAAEIYVWKCGRCSASHWHDHSWEPKADLRWPDVRAALDRRGEPASVVIEVEQGMEVECSSTYAQLLRTLSSVAAVKFVNELSLLS